MAADPRTEPAPPAVGAEPPGDFAAPSPARAIARLLTFRLQRSEMLALGRPHLVVGLLCTWVVGMGRWWDDREASLLQHLGLGSVLYAFVLAGLLWLLVLPLKPRDWSYQRVLTFVTMTSPPAVLYAIPVERFFSMSTAGQLNLWFLAIVAAWRVALLLFFLIRLPRIGTITAVATALLPLASIVTALTALNLHRVVLNIMGSIAAEDRSAQDAAYGLLVALTMLSVTVLPLLLLFYVGAIIHRRLRKDREASD